jgi:hypothetical protein
MAEVLDFGRKNVGDIGVLLYKTLANVEVTIVRRPSIEEIKDDDDPECLFFIKRTDGKSFEDNDIETINNKKEALFHEAWIRITRPNPWNSKEN